MIAVLDETLAKIHAEQRSVGEAVPPPAAPAAIDEARYYVRSSLGGELASGYVAFLFEANGLDFNGTIVYAVGESDQSILNLRQLNDIFHEDGNRDYILYGETGDELFAQERSTDTWHILDRGSLSSLETFADFDLLLSRVLTRAYES